MRELNELVDAVVALRRLRDTGGCQSVWRGRFLTAFRKLEEAEQRRPVSGREIARSVSVISEVLCGELLKHVVVSGRNGPSR